MKKVIIASMSSLILLSTIPSNMSFAATLSDTKNPPSHETSKVEFDLNDPKFLEHPVFQANKPLEHTKQDTDVLSKYISVVNNRYVLNIPEKDKNKFSSDLIAKAQYQVNQSNSLISETDTIINPKTKVGTATDSNGIQTRKYGKTGILRVEWNYVRIGLDRKLVKDISSSGFGMGGTIGSLLGAKYGRKFGPKGQTIATIVGGVIGTVMNNHFKKEAMYFDFNYWRGVNNWGYQ